MTRIATIFVIAIGLLAAVQALRLGVSDEEPERARQSAEAVESAQSIFVPESPQEIPLVTAEPDRQVEGALEPSEPQHAAMPSRVQTWSEQPEIVEDRIREYLSSGEYGLLWDATVTCT